jgi:hypothetical protein
MTTATEMTAPEKFSLSEKVADEDAAPYRAVSRAAVVSAVLGVVSLLSLAFATLLILPLVGLALGLSALSTIRRFPNEYTGTKLAAFGAVVSVMVFVGGVTWHSYVYATEVPEGYTRVGFWELQPDPDHPEYLLPPKAMEIAGSKIFIKGYMHPGVASGGKVDHFILVPDMGTCCFGGQPKPTDMIEIEVKDRAQRVAYSTRRIKLAGTFRLSQRPQTFGKLENVWYHLEVDQVR